MTLTGFDLAEVKELFESGSMENVHEDNYDVEKELRKTETPITKQGDLWCLGRHRLVCGDSTKSEYYRKLLDEKIADLLVTVPPYNIDYGRTLSGNGRDIANDNCRKLSSMNFL